MSTPVEDLRAAARLLRETASEATPGPWQSASGEAIGLGIEEHGPGSYSYDVELAYVTSGAQREEDLSHDPGIEVGTQAGDAAWIALMSPDKAEPLVTWLEESAADVAHTKTVRTRSIRLALTFARSILGRIS